MSKRRQVVFRFGEGEHEDAVKVLGGKGSGLSEMVSMGLPVPPGFTVSTTVGRALKETGEFPKRFDSQLERCMHQLEGETGKRFGSAENPLLVSVRSGAQVSMPGMMDSVLNLGMHDDIACGLGATLDFDFAYDCQRRFEEQYRAVVLGGRGEIPLDPWDQLRQAITAVFASWDSARALEYRAMEEIPSWWSTAVNVQAMVFGNLGQNSATGVVFSQDVSTGRHGMWGEFLPNAQGEDVVAGDKNPLPITEMRASFPQVYEELEQAVAMLERHYDDVVDVEFTVESGKLYILQVRRAKRTPQAAATIAVHFVWEGQWSKEKAVASVSQSELRELKRPKDELNPVDVEHCRAAGHIVRGLAASVGCATGIACFTSESAQALAREGKRPILFRRSTSPDDLAGMRVSTAIVTSTGGETCHAAVVARSLGIPAVVGCEGLWITKIRAETGDFVIREGDEISVSGTDGFVAQRAIPCITGAPRTKEENIFLRWASKRPIGDARIGFEYVETRTSVNTVLNDVYLAEAMAHAARDSKLEQDAEGLHYAVLKRSAELFACYLTIAVSGELRYAQNGGSAHVVCAEGQSAFRALRDRFHVFTDRNRLSNQISSLEQLSNMQREDHAEFFRNAAILFNKGRWESSIGGPLWGSIAEAPYEYLTGAWSASEFVDRVFDLRHNGGRLFDKHGMVERTREYALQQQLSEKHDAKGVVDLYKRLRAIYSIVSDEVESLFQRGQKLGLWT